MDDQLDFSKAEVDTGHPLNPSDSSTGILGKYEPRIAAFLQSIDKPISDATINAGKEALHQVNPWEIGQGLAKIVRHPLDTLDTLIPSSDPNRPFIGDTIKNSVEQGASNLVSGDPNKVGETIGDIGGIAAQNKLLSMLSGAAVPASISKALSKSALKNYINTLKPQNAKYGELSVPKAKDIAQGMADRGIVAGSAESLQRQAQEGMAKHGPEVTPAYSNPTNNPVLVPAAQAGASASGPALTATNKMEIFKDLDTFLHENVVDPKTGRIDPGGEGLVNHVQNLKSMLTDMQDPTTGDIPQVDMLNLKRRLAQKTTGAGAKFKMGEQLDPDTVSAGNDALRDSIMDKLHRANNVGEAVDSAYHFYSGLNDFAENQANAKLVNNTNANFWQTLTQSKALKLPKSIVTFANSVPWNTVSGAAKMKFATSLAGKNFPKALTQLQLLKLGVPIDKLSDSDESNKE